MLRTAFIPVSLALLQACSSPDPTPPPVTPPEQNSPLLEGLPGHWVHQEPGSDYRFEERWTLQADGGLEGLGIVRSGNDTVMIEYLNIATTDSGTIYSARIPAQNAGEPVLFRMDHDVDSLVFTNAHHDYPQRIAYLPQGSSGWNVRLNGMRNGAAMQELLHFVPAGNSGPETP
ncbi:MAG: DUF6265 family protein [Flavobacteriales bacterium]